MRQNPSENLILKILRVKRNNNLIAKLIFKAHSGHFLNLEEGLSNWIFLCLHFYINFLYYVRNCTQFKFIHSFILSFVDKSRQRPIYWLFRYPRILGNFKWVKLDISGLLFLFQRSVKLINNILAFWKVKNSPMYIFNGALNCVFCSAEKGFSKRIWPSGIYVPDAATIYCKKRSFLCMLSHYDEWS